MLTLFSPGFSLMPLKNGRPGFRHRFCGGHDLNGGECPNCHKPLLRFLALDLRDPLLASAPDCPTFPVRVLHLLFCWTCNVAQAPFFYKIVSDDEIRLLTFGAGGDDALSGGRGFVDNPSVQVLFRVCPTCAVLGAWQECD